MLQAATKHCVTEVPPTQRVWTLAKFKQFQSKENKPKYLIGGQLIILFFPYHI